MTGKLNDHASPARPASRRAPKAAGGARLGEGCSVEARKQAAAILEVLAGARTPPQAAVALAVSLPRYYQLEAWALAGLLAACEPRPRGRGRGPAVNEAAKLRRDNERLQREVARQQALVRLVQRSLGLPPALPATPKVAGKKPRKRRPVARALAVADRLRDGAVEPVPAAPPAAGSL